MKWMITCKVRGAWFEEMFDTYEEMRAWIERHGKRKIEIRRKIGNTWKLWD